MVGSSGRTELAQKVLELGFNLREADLARTARASSRYEEEAEEWLVRRNLTPALPGMEITQRRLPQLCRVFLCRLGLRTGAARATIQNARGVVLSSLLNSGS